MAFSSIYGWISFVPLQLPLRGRGKRKRRRGRKRRNRASYRCKTKRNVNCTLITFRVFLEQFIRAWLFNAYYSVRCLTSRHSSSVFCSRFHYTSTINCFLMTNYEWEYFLTRVQLRENDSERTTTNDVVASGSSLFVLKNFETFYFYFISLLWYH